MTRHEGPIYADGERDPGTGRPRYPTLATLRALESFPYGADGCAVDTSWFAGAGAEAEPKATAAGP